MWRWNGVACRCEQSVSAHRPRPPRFGPRGPSLGLSLQHHLYDLLLHGPGRLVMDSKLALQFKGLDRVLALGQQVHGLEPGREGELRALEDGPGSRTSLRPATMALEQAPGHAAVPVGPALRALEAVGPTGLADTLYGLVLGAVVGHELPEGEALLKLNVVPPHVVFPPKSTVLVMDTYCRI
jgi:hypothetical protein